MAEPRDYPTFHPAPPLRLLAALGGTALTATARAGVPGASLHAWARATLPRLGVHVSLLSPIPEGAPLWVSNHLSWIDPLIFLGLRGSGALAKREVAAYPLLGPGARRMGIRFVDRDCPFSGAVALKGIRKELTAGRHFLLFPEGTTTRGETLAPLREGGLRLAFRLGVQVLPFRLESPDPHYPWTGDASLLPHLARLARTRRTEVRLRPGPVLAPAAFRDEDRFVAAIRNHLSPGTCIAEAS